MKHKVVGKQPNSKMCYVFGLKNPKGLKASFYELENGEVVGRFVAGDDYQGYPDRLHGCIAAGRLYEGTAELNLPDGTVAVEASGKYFNLIGDTLPREKLKAQEWKVYPAEDDPRELDI